ncbi:MAG: sulfite exporter TauE/SafE family protein [Actinobacteria bacterium]|nr:sulfite exporter TauE/SafE family protein [Actinomycetota bacterium]
MSDQTNQEMPEPPREEAPPPREEVEAPREEATAPREEVEAPREEAPPPADEFTPPVVEAAAPTDANALRGHHFKRLLHKQLTWWLIGVPAVVIGGFLLTVNVVFGLIVALAIVAIGIGVVFAIADSKAADDFFHVYAENHRLELGGKSKLPSATPLLRKGDDRYANRTLAGEIAPGCTGMLALYTYEEQTTDSDGNRQTNYHRFTLGMSEVPECTDHVPELYCQKRVGLRSMEKFEDVFRRSKRRVTLESEALGDRYEIFVGKEQDEVWLRRLFSPSFIVWLTESAPEKFAFELVSGTLVAYVPKHREDATDLDEVAAATGAVAKRLREKSDEPDA